MRDLWDEYFDGRLGAAIGCAFVIVMVLALTACKPGASITCPPLQQYSAAEQKAAARELDAIYTVAPTITRMMTDYGVTRNAIRACLKRRK